MSAAPPGTVELSASGSDGSNATATATYDPVVEPGLDVTAIANLDLVVTVDTAVAHLAGALGRPAWVMLRAMPDWRWLVDHDDSPWYPTVRLFRQRRRGDWDEVVRRVRTALKQRL